MRQGEPQRKKSSQKETLMDIENFRIKRSLPLKSPLDPSIDIFIESIERTIFRFIKEKGIHLKSTLHEAFDSIVQMLPIFDWELPQEPFGSISIIGVTSGKYSHGLGRYLGDMCTRWLIPGTIIPLPALRCLTFRFEKFPDQPFFITAMTLEPRSIEELELAKKNIPFLMREIHVNLNTVEYARRIVSSDRLSSSEQKLLFEENIASVMQLPENEIEQDTFDKLQQLLFTASAEEKALNLRSYLTPIIEKRPEVFDPDLFKEFRSFILLLPPRFMGVREMRHITRILAYNYFFRKSVFELAAKSPTTRHLYFKVFQTKIAPPEGNHHVLAIALAMNFLHENEIFEEKHLVSALKSILDDVEVVENSYFCDERTSHHISTFYIEIRKKNRARFTIDEVRQARRTLPREIHSRIEAFFQPLFVHRNEEEIMKSIVDLSNQLKLLHDLPQLIINFHRQTQKEISFTAILLRVQKPDSLPIRATLESSKEKGVRFTDLDIKTVGLLRRRYPKEASVFTVHVSKEDYIRKDFTVDLYEARRKVLTSLQALFGEIRDYNGGMMSKQREVLADLKKGLARREIENDHLIENFFYSLKPTFMQSLLPSNVLESFFLLFSRALELSYSETGHSFMKEVSGEFLVLMIGSSNQTFTERIKATIEDLDFMSELIISSHNFYDISTLGYLICTHFKEDISTLERTIQTLIDEEVLEQKKKKEHEDKMNFFLEERPSYSEISL